MAKTNSELVFALAGNPNCGKTTLFNALTGSHYQVGNWAGVTVERKEGVCVFDKRVKIVDLPGIYSLSPNSAEEVLARDYIVKEKPDLILNIADATNLERNLYLTTQLAELGAPMIIALNMMDALGEIGLAVDIKTLEKEIGIKIMPISASKGLGVSDLAAEAVAIAKNRALPDLKYAPDTEAEERCRFIKKAVKKAVTKTGPNRQALRTDKIDAVVNHPIFAIPIFIAVMFVIFMVTFGKFGTFLSDCVDTLFNVKFAGFVADCFEKWQVAPFVSGLVTDGIIAGVGGVVTFFPQIMLLFLFLSFLEGSGYMARTAFIMDKLFMRLGLSGKSFVPMVMGFGCSVPAIMSVRTLENERDRKLTLLLLPFMSCSAKTPVYAVFAAAFFPDHAGLVTFSLYLLGIVLGIISGLIFSKTILKGDIPPFVLELPPYRMPTLKAMLHHMRDKAKDFALRAGTALLMASVIIWLLQNLNLGLRLVGDSRDSILGAVGQLIAPVFKPCGFGNRQAAVSLLSGFAAKEAVVSTMSILYGAQNRTGLITALRQEFTPLSAYSFLVFVLLYVPCIAAVSTLSNELNSKKLTVFSVCWQIGSAWLVSTLIYQTGSIFI